MFNSESLLIKAIRGFLSNPVSKFRLTYHIEFINEDSAWGAKK